MRGTVGIKCVELLDERIDFDGEWGVDVHSGSMKVAPAEAGTEA